ncbi:hypothetical protein H6P81_014079 [Aristolochia fimbriata]|uniref:Uncharacterized protein n=1 Tax=Aristolochia fimbriata TaxID=158543 RepID=A0AAV7EHN9_ARIFI|nr:hypothetical protein H6P81_014079 [Aristolochia fimbriata]
MEIVEQHPPPPINPPTMIALQASIQDLVNKWQKLQKWHLFFHCQKRAHQTQKRAPWRTHLGTFLESTPVHIASLSLLLLDLIFTLEIIRRTRKRRDDAVLSLGRSRDPGRAGGEDRGPGVSSGSVVLDPPRAGRRRRGGGGGAGAGIVGSRRGRRVTGGGEPMAGGEGRGERVRAQRRGYSISDRRHSEPVRVAAAAESDSGATHQREGRENRGAGRSLGAPLPNRFHHSDVRYSSPCT